jgi:hypothetical protein
MPRELLPIFVWSLIRMSWDPVFRFVQRIPRGKVLTYGALAKSLRLPGGARSAGRAMAATPSRVDLKRHLWKPPQKSTPKHGAPQKRIQK